MKVLVYPADRFGCGHHRLIWPAETLRRTGHDVTVIEPSERYLTLHLDEERERVVAVKLPPDVDVVVLQRVTHRYLAQAVAVMRAQGIAVVIDIDDDLAAIHPANPVWVDLHPRRNERVVSAAERPHLHSWHNLAQACRDATLVTVTTPALLKRYAGHGRGRELRNYLAAHYFDVERVDSTRLGWPASLHSHPDDPGALGNAVARLVAEGWNLHVTSTEPREQVARAFGVAPSDAHAVVTLSASGPVNLLDWPRRLAELGVGVAPLADTRFNAAKSWLKPLELAAAGVPWVASPRAEYRRLHALGCGVLVDKPKAWYATLRDLLTDEGRRTELSAQGRAVAETLRIEQHAWRWWEAWSDALALQRGAGSASRGSSAPTSAVDVART